MSGIFGAWRNEIMKTTLKTGILYALIGVFFIAAQSFAATKFLIHEVAGDEDFPEGVEEGAIKFVCAESEEALSALFRSKDLPFDPELVKNRGGRKCHVWYEPSLKGFRADADNQTVERLIYEVDTLSFLAGRTEIVGDSLDVVKEILPYIERPLEITIGVNHALEEIWYQDALNLHFKDLHHSVVFREKTAPEVNPWVQDFVKSGKAGGESLLMLPRRLLEGSSEYGEKYCPLLDELETKKHCFRSKLSWEGGDIQFLKHPLNPGKTILFYGDTAKNYWGKELTKEEYAYVLMLEFGADFAVDLSGLAPHIDYFVSFIPDENTALVSVPLTGSQGLAYSALEALGQRLNTPYTSEIMEMAKSLSVSALEFRKEKSEIRKVMEQLKKTQSDWTVEEKVGIQRRLESYIARSCSEDPDDCFSGKSQEKMFQEDLSLLRDWISSAAVLRTDVAMIPALLSVIESQLPDYKIPDIKLRERKIAELEALGLKVIRVPRIAGDKSLEVPWSGISYVNNLLVDKILFVPSIGLPGIENMILDDIRSQMPKGYKVIPIYARHLILNNGGIHCATGIVRGS